MEKILHKFIEGHAKMSDIDLLLDVSKKIEGNTICPLGDAAAWPVASAIKHFRADFEKLVTGSQSPVTGHRELVTH